MGDPPARRRALELESALQRPVELRRRGRPRPLFQASHGAGGRCRIRAAFQPIGRIEREPEALRRDAVRLFKAWWATWRGARARRMRVINSHTEGEPTRLIVEGGPPLGRGPLAERRQRFAEAFDHIRRFAVNEPRGFDALVGALLCEPEDPSCAAGRDLLQQRRLSRHVRPWDDRRGGDAGASRPYRPRRPSLRDAGRHRSASNCIDKHHVVVENVESYRH